MVSELGRPRIFYHPSSGAGSTEHKLAHRMITFRVKTLKSEGYPQNRTHRNMLLFDIKQLARSAYFTGGDARQHIDVALGMFNKYLPANAKISRDQVEW